VINFPNVSNPKVPKHTLYRVFFACFGVKKSNFA
jgi:hypothetical protein